MDVESRVNRMEIFEPMNVMEEPIATPEDYLVCRRIMSAASRNYSFASRFFPSDKLPHVEALYALMRVGDDRVDVSHHGFQSSLEAIDNWEYLYQEAFRTGWSDNPVIRAYLNTALIFNIPKDTMRPYFRAMRDDLTITRFPTFDDLVYYMEGSAIPVGRAMTHILGVRKPYGLQDALPGADSLSIAMQLSNFWRDIGYDLEIGRIYLPLEDLDRFHLSEAVLEKKVVTPGLIDLLEFEFERTDRFYTAARESISLLESGRWAVMSGLEIYRAILSEIRHNHYDVFKKKAGASTGKKFGLALKAYMLASLQHRAPGHGD